MASRLGSAADFSNQLLRWVLGTDSLQRELLILPMLKILCD
jgi:hypothetical protein